MDEEERQFLLTAAWVFMRHGRRERARNVCEALCETDPRDGVAAAALAELLLADGEAPRALEVLRAAAVARGYTLDELERVRAEKASKRGGFEKKILLKEVIK